MPNAEAISIQQLKRIQRATKLRSRFWMAQHTISIILSVQRMSGVSRECPENRGHIWTQLASFGRIQPIFFNDLGG